ncbi:MAG: Na/Pi symporter [Vicinamibacterales bacterium]|nr:Na/Pi symporter [Vicinamibacterales bacterium]
MIVTLAGGLGLFLLGMVLMTDGLKAAAGNQLRATLAHLTGGAGRAVLTGVVITALVQSSSATVVATIGFVSAGLLTFPRAAGLILGASLGTTSTGWLVAVVGLKLSLGAAALPFVGLGALLRLLGRGRWAAIGLAIAGFGLVFFAVSLLEEGMATLATRFDPATLPGTSIGGRTGLVAIGVAMTVVMQSSSAAMATTLTAFHAGTIGLAQGASLVIGQSIGTTVTAGLAAVGASVPARRTALVHVIFNVIAGVVAFLVLPLFLAAADLANAGRETMALPVFHTVFTGTAVALVLPFIGTLTRVVTRLLPERSVAPTRHLDDSVAEVPAVAVEAARRATADVAARVIALLPGGLPADTARPARVAEADDALIAIRHFLARVRTSADTPHEHLRHQSVLHAVDHLERLLEEMEEREVQAGGDADVEGVWREAAPLLYAARVWVAGAVETFDAAPLGLLAEDVRIRRQAHRRTVLADAARGLMDPDQALARVDAMRRADRLLHHAWRAIAHLSGNGA